MMLAHELIIFYLILLFNTGMPICIIFSLGRFYAHSTYIILSFLWIHGAVSFTSGRYSPLFPRGRHIIYCNE